jgi:hypothetical protein
MRRHIHLSRAILAALALACSCSEELPPPRPDRPTIDERRFTAALSDLVVARIQLLPDTASYTRRATEILREHGVTEEEMRSFVEIRGQDDDVMTRSYARVSARLDTLFPVALPGAVEPEVNRPGAEAIAPSAEPGAAEATAPSAEPGAADTAATAP